MISDEFAKRINRKKLKEFDVLRCVKCNKPEIMYKYQNEYYCRYCGLIESTK